MQLVVWKDQPIEAPCAVSDMPMPAYHRADVCKGAVSVSSSFLRDLIRFSPAHAYHRSPFNPDRPETDETEAMALGSFIHAAITGKPFKDEFALCPPDYNARTKIGQKWKADQIAAGKTIITPTMARHAKGMIISLGNFPLVKGGMLTGLSEIAMFWRDRRGFIKKAKPDMVPNDSGDFVDLKTTSSVLYRDLQRSIVDFGYHQQAAMVMEGARALGIPANSFTLLWVENKPPYCVRATTFKDEDLARGQQLNDMAADIFWQCHQSGNWPGPGDDRPDAEYIDLPEWSRKSIDDRVKYQLREAA